MFKSTKYIEKYSVLLSSILLLSFAIFVIYQQGIGRSLDTNSYNSYANDLIKHDFNIIELVKEHYPRIATYSIPIYIMGFIKYFAHEDWKSYFLIFNLFCVAAMLWRFSSTLKQLNTSQSAISFAIFLAIISIDHIVWPRFILTDTMYSLMVLYIFTLPIHLDVRKPKSMVCFTCMLIILMFTRPTALPVVLACIIFAISHYSRWFIFRPKWLLSILAFSVVLFTLVWAYFFYQYGLGNITPNTNLDYIYRFIENGSIVTERTGSSIVINGAFSDYVFLFILRLIFFFSPYSHEFSFLHNLFNFIWITSFFMSLIGAIVLNKRGLLKKEQRLVITGLIILIVSVCSYHCAILIDYDWRYRYPIILPMLMIVSMVSSLFLSEVKKTLKAKISTA